MASLVPLAHTGHYLWVLYLPPILIVIGSILRTKIKEKKLKKRDASASPAGGFGGGGSRTARPAAPPSTDDRTRS